MPCVESKYAGLNTTILDLQVSSYLCIISAAQDLRVCYDVCPVSAPQGLRVCYDVCPVSAPQGLRVYYDICPVSAPQGLRGHTQCTFMWMYLLLLMNVHNMLPYMISMEYNIKELCKLVKLTIFRSIIQRHDYKFYVRKLCCPSNSNDALLFLQGFIISHLYAIQIGKAIHTTCKQLFCSKLLSIFLPNSMKEIEDVSCNNSQAGLVGGGLYAFSYEDIQPYMLETLEPNNDIYKFKTHVKMSEAYQYDNVCTIPMEILVKKLTIAELKLIARLHNIQTTCKIQREIIQDLLIKHKCDNCTKYVSAFLCIKAQDLVRAPKVSNLASVRKYQKRKGSQYKSMNLKSVKAYQKKNQYVYKENNRLSAEMYQERENEKYREAHTAAVLRSRKIIKKHVFPPPAPTYELQHQIISEACNDMTPNQIQEQGCAICGRLTQKRYLRLLVDVEANLDILVRPFVTQVERKSTCEPVTQLLGPVLLPESDKICMKCHSSLKRRKIPVMSLANGHWIGEVPDALQGLSFTEQLLVARVRHNRCIIRVSSGMHKMRANAITFANPIPKVYDVLPPAIEELDEVLAFIYTGPCQPTKADFERIPLLVRHKKVRGALEWLKLNHSDYYDLEISLRNLERYPEDEPPVVVDYRLSYENKDPEATAVYDNEREEGVEKGVCPFVVHGLTGEDYSTKNIKTLKAIALDHLTRNRKILAIGHAPEAESIYNNPQLFPQMMPWLFPYGLGGIGNNLQIGHVSDIAHKQHLLMYHDKRFQKDPYFPLIAFNHEQIKQSTSAGYLLAEKTKFDDISKCLLDVDLSALSSLASRMEKGDVVVPETEEEKVCFQLIKDIDHVGGHVKGSVTSKKYMRNEIWALISFIGAPSWFITFAPADVKHPISLYYADTEQTFDPCIRSYEERYKLIAQNPVAGARFFHYMSEIFIKHVLGMGKKHPGLYGETAAYYGTVEQQGCLTLHMHMLLWIKGALSPQEI